MDLYECTGDTMATTRKYCWDITNDSLECEREDPLLPPVQTKRKGMKWPWLMLDRATEYPITSWKRLNCLTSAHFNGKSKPPIATFLRTDLRTSHRSSRALCLHAPSPEFTKPRKNYFHCAILCLQLLCQQEGIGLRQTLINAGRDGMATKKKRRNYLTSRIDVFCNIFWIVDE